MIGEADVDERAAPTGVGGRRRAVGRHDHLDAVELAQALGDLAAEAAAGTTHVDPLVRPHPVIRSSVPVATTATLPASQVATTDADAAARAGFPP